VAEFPYNLNILTPSVYGDRRPVRGEIVALLHITFDHRNLELIVSRSRGLGRNEIHELMITDDDKAGPGSGVDRVSAIAFFEVLVGGLVVVGDKVSIGGRPMGWVSGYDMTHMPNHMNVLVKTETLDIDPISVGDNITIKKT
jgi:hypothetical protein